MNTYYSFFTSPAGELLLTSDGDAITGLFVRGGDHFPQLRSDWIENSDVQIFQEAREQLLQYFNGKRTVFAIRIAPVGTDFQKDVWKHLLEIPYGKTLSYGELAERMGKPKAVRAVGQANGRNPISILVPCHRVIGADGSLTGYGGGMKCKEFLLQLEGGSINASKTNQQLRLEIMT